MGNIFSLNFYTRLIWFKIRRIKNSSPGSATIFMLYMLKNLHSNSFSYLLPILSSFLLKNIYPLPLWTLAIILPILKPSKDSSLPDSYRPIAQTSILGKFKGLYYGNSKLTKYFLLVNKDFKKAGIFSDLKKQINNATNTNFTHFSISPRVWRYYIRQKPHQIGLRGNNLKLKQNFLHPFSTRLRSPYL